MARKRNRGKRAAPRFTIGDLVSFRFGNGSLAGKITEDRGGLGVGGQRLYGITFEVSPGVETYTEVPEMLLNPVEPFLGQLSRVIHRPASHDPGVQFWVVQGIYWTDYRGVIRGTLSIPGGTEATLQTGENLSLILREDRHWGIVVRALSFGVERTSVHFVVTEVQSPHSDSQDRPPAELLNRA